MATSKIKRGVNVETYTETGTTNASGVLLLSHLPHPYDVTPVIAKSSDAAHMCIVWRYSSGTWYAMVLNWQTFTRVTNTSVTLDVSYVYNA